MMQWLRRMMLGRYGIDQLGYALIGGSLVCVFLQGLTGWGVLYFLGLVLLAVGYLRFFSRDIEKRRRENGNFLHWWNPIRELLGIKGRELTELRTHRHFKCPSCGQKVRVPRGRGRVSISCPKCNMSFIKKT